MFKTFVVCDDHLFGSFFALIAASEKELRQFVGESDFLFHVCFSFAACARFLGL